MPGSTALVGEQGAAVNKRTNRIYRMWQPIWATLANVREGTGGFLDGTYLVAHPREWLDHTITQTTKDASGNSVTVAIGPNLNPKKPSPKLIRRRQLARYENFGGKIIDQMKAALFREDPMRRVGDEKKTAPAPIELFWQNIERRQSHPVPDPPLEPPALDQQPRQRASATTSITKFWPQAWDVAATFGHMFIVMDRPQGDPGMTQADQRTPFLRMYTPLDAIDWLLDDQGNLVEIKFLELVQRRTLDDVENPILFNIRVFTPQYWALYTRDGDLVEGGPGTSGEHKMGRVPVTVLYAKRRNLVPLIGHSVLDDPTLYIDLYNLTSELRELLRNQTFGILNVQLGPDESVADAQASMGHMSGTESVLFSRGEAKYTQPSADNVKSYQDERTALIRTIYRLSAIAWEADTKDAEAQGSLKLKREDLNQMLSGFASELERTEQEIAELFYRATYGPDGWESRLKADQVVIRYPDTFDATPFDVVLAQAEAALALGMPPAFTKELRKRLVVKFLPDAPQSLIDEINLEIESGSQEATTLHKALAARLAQTAQPAAPQPGVDEPIDPALAALSKQSTTDGRMTAVDAVAP